MVENQGASQKDFLGKAFNVIDSIDYQEGAIVSKTLINKKTGTVTLFSFDKGQELSEHTAPFDALVHVVDGQAEVKISGNPHVVSAGQMIIMPANKPHALRAIERFKMVLILVKNQ